MGRVIPFRPHVGDDWLPRTVSPSQPPQPPRSAAGFNPFAPPRAAAEHAPRAVRIAHPRRHRWVVCALLVAAVFSVATLLHGHTSGDAGPGVGGAAHAGGASSSPGADPLTWTTRQGIAFPMSATCGPLRHDGLVASGFSRDDLGAAIAAAWIVYQASPEPGPAVYRPALATQVTGPAALTLADTVAAGYAEAAEESHLADGAPLGKGTTTFTGYHVTARAGGERHVTIYERAPDANGIDQVFTLDVDLIWSDGDWKVVAPVSGDWSSAFAQLPAAPPGVTAFSPAAPSPAAAS